MPFREPLFVGSLTEAAQKYLGTQDDGAPQPPPGYDDDRPMLHGFGPVEFSTCADLAVVPEICWDVNGYYRTMGVWWRATKKELMLAYQSFGPMPSAYQTYVFKQLLNPVIRRAYDRAPLGEIFIDDYVRDELAREAHRRAQKMRMRGVEITAEDILDEMGYRAIPEDEPSEVVDGGDPDDDDDEVPPDDADPLPFKWAFYLWKTRKIDLGRLAQWQELLVSAFATRKERVRLAVGFHGAGPHPWVVGEVGYRTVVFLRHDEQPDTAMAQAVVDRVVNPAGSRKRALTS